jgi:hypothetical protein
MNPSPEQIAQWRKATEKPYHDEYGIDNDARTKCAYTLGYLRARTEQTTEIAELKDDLQFVERWAVHHGTKSHMTPENALSIIQHYPAITAITKSYADGKVPGTFNPFAQIAELKAQIEVLRDALYAATSKDTTPNIESKLVEPTFTGLKKVSTESLPPGFEKILHDNLWELYESDNPADTHTKD